MAQDKKDLRSRLDLEAEALAALEVARSLPAGAERTEAMKKAGILQNAAGLPAGSLAKRGRPGKN